MIPTNKNFIIDGLPFPHYADTLPEAVEIAKQGLEKYRYSSASVVSIYQKVALIRQSGNNVIEYLGVPQ